MSISIHRGFALHTDHFLLDGQGTTTRKHGRWTVLANGDIVDGWVRG
jgi:hypothetical protein